jgi:hypothetical protein
MNIDVTDEQRRQIEAHSACVVWGRQCPHKRSHGRMGHLTCEDCGATSDPASGYRWRSGFVIPQPWLDATKPCETCGGREYAPMPHDGMVPCWADCRDGHPIIDVRAKCTATRGDCDGFICRPCGSTGWVSLGRYTVTLVASGPMFDYPPAGILPVPGSDMLAVLTKADQ